MANFMHVYKIWWCGLKLGGPCMASTCAVFQGCMWHYCRILLTAGLLFPLFSYSSLFYLSSSHLYFPESLLLTTAEQIVLLLLLNPAELPLLSYRIPGSVSTVVLQTTDWGPVLKLIGAMLIKCIQRLIHRSNQISSKPKLQQIYLI